jgi:hypothetical protein
MTKKAIVSQLRQHEKYERLVAAAKKLPPLATAVEPMLLRPIRRLRPLRKSPTRRECPSPPSQLVENVASDHAQPSDRARGHGALNCLHPQLAEPLRAAYLPTDPSDEGVCFPLPRRPRRTCRLAEAGLRDAVRQKPRTR